MLFGSNVSTAQMTEAIIGGLVGVTATKTIAAAAPGNLTGTPIMRTVTSIAAALASGWVGRMFSQRFGDAVMFGGLMQAGSVALNAFIPQIGGHIGLNGLGDLVEGAFPVPQNPLNPLQPNYPGYGHAIPAGAYGNGAPVEMSGLNRAFGRAF